jgi:hypothetical protein
MSRFAVIIIKPLKEKPHGLWKAQEKEPAPSVGP